MEFKVAGFHCFWSWQLQGVQCIATVQEGTAGPLKSKLLCSAHSTLQESCSTRWRKNNFTLGLDSQAIFNGLVKHNKVQYFAVIQVLCILTSILSQCAKNMNPSVSCLHQNKTVWYWIFLFYFVAAEWCSTTSTFNHTY